MTKLSQNLWLFMAKANKKEFRGYIPADLDKLVRALSVIKNGERDWSLSDVLTEALQDWISKPENKALIDKHNLSNLQSDQ